MVGLSLLRTLAQPVLNLLERRLLARAPAQPSGPLIIVGPPRSGTTLISQVLTTCFHTSYISNAAYRFYETPVAASRLRRNVIQNYRSDFTSSYGKTVHAGEPNEGDRFWKRWFPADERAVDADYLSAVQSDDMARTIAGLQEVLGGPFVNKHVGHSVRMLALAKAMPGTCFLWVKRDPITTARSIHKARQERVAGGKQRMDQWWSAQPREIGELVDRPVLEQICGQVYYLNRNIEEDAQRLAAGRCESISYEQFCEQPRAELERVRAWLKSQGVPLEWRSAPPDTFKASKPTAKDQPLIDELNSAWSRLTSAVCSQ